MNKAFRMKQIFFKKFSPFELYSELCQTSKIGLFSKINSFQLLTIVGKSSILSVWQIQNRLLQCNGYRTWQIEKIPMTFMMLSIIYWHATEVVYSARSMELSFFSQHLTKALQPCMRFTFSCIFALQNKTKFFPPTIWKYIKW